MRKDILTGVAEVGLLVFLAIVLAACGGEIQPEPASDLFVSQSEQSFNSGVAHFDQGEYEIAIRDFNEAIRLDPTYALAYWSKGTALIYMGHFQPAIDELDDAIRLDPQLGMAYRSRGLAYVGLGRVERGIEEYNTAVRLEPRFGLIYADRAIAYAHMEDDTAAQRDVELAVEFGVTRAILESALQKIRDGR